jgi:predicted GNAT family N-acyltransferase
MSLIKIELIKGKEALSKTGSLRLEVFEQEQGFVDEFDDLDDASIHAILYENDHVIASGRMYEEHPNVYHLGRIVVKKEKRGQRYGQRIVNELVAYAKKQGATQCVLSSQTHACRFYETCGFNQQGPVYLDQNQPHQWMVKLL